MTTTEKNLLIALFMGYESYIFRGRTMIIFEEDNHRTDNDMYYHASWDWLIPVLKKIDDLLYASYVDSDNTVQDFINKWWETNTKTLQYTNDQLKFGTDINEVYDDVIDFINFYNKYTNGRYN
jgi:hypothetical protein